MNNYVIRFGSELIIVEGYDIKQSTENSVEVETDYCSFVKISFSDIIHSINSYKSRKEV